MSMIVENKVALVTGANRGIGKSIVESFIKHGAKRVYLAVRDLDSTKELEDKYGNKVVTVKADLSNTESIENLAQQTTDVEIVVNNAGIGNPQVTIGKEVEKELQKQLDANVFGFYEWQMLLLKH